MSLGKALTLLTLVSTLSCVSGTGGHRTESKSTQTRSGSREQALVVLQAAISSDSADIRAAGFSAWLGSGDPSASAVVLRAGLDPSPHVQRSLAEEIPGMMASVVAEHHAPDPLAVAWLRFAGEDVASPSGEGPMTALASAIGGDVRGREALISFLQEGDVPPEASFYRLLGRVRIEGLAQALVDGTLLSEPEVQLSMALAVLAQGHPDGPDLLAKVLEGTEDPMAPFQVIEALARAPVAGSKGWLQRARRSRDSDVALYAALGLVALGEVPVTRAEEALQSPDRDTRAWALECIGRFHQDRPLPRDRLALLQRSARDESPAVKEAAIRAIFRVDDSGDLPVPLIITAGDLDRVSIVIAGEWVSRSPEGG